MFVYQVYVLLSIVCISIKVATPNVCMLVNTVKSYWYVQMKKSIVSQSRFLFTITSWNRFKQPYSKNSEYEQNNL